VSDEAVVKPDDITDVSKRLGYSQTEFGALFRVAQPVVAGWERGTNNALKGHASCTLTDRPEGLPAIDRRPPISRKGDTSRGSAAPRMIILPPMPRPPMAAANALALVAVARITEIRAVERRRSVDLSGEKAFTGRAQRHEADAQFIQGAHVRLLIRAPRLSRAMPRLDRAALVHRGSLPPLDRAGV
jgi:hypothetical protein